jgi:hypothetical protein
MASSDKGTKEYVCNCPGSACGVGKDHHQIWLNWSAKFGDDPHNREVHKRWKVLGKKAAAGRL